MTRMPTFVVFWLFWPISGPPADPPQQSQKKSLKPQNSRCFDRIGTRLVIKKNTHQDQIFAFLGSCFLVKIWLFFSRFDRIGTGSYSIDFFWNLDPSSQKMTIFNIQKCILNYYTSVKVGSYSIETICTGSYSIETLFFSLKIGGFLFYRNTLYHSLQNYYSQLSYS